MGTSDETHIQSVSETQNSIIQMGEKTTLQQFLRQSLHTLQCNHSYVITFRHISLRFMEQESRKHVKN